MKQTIKLIWSCFILFLILIAFFFSIGYLIHSFVLAFQFGWDLIDNFVN